MPHRYLCCLTLSLPSQLRTTLVMGPYHVNFSEPEFFIKKGDCHLLTMWVLGHRGQAPGKRVHIGVFSLFSTLSIT